MTTSYYEPAEGAGLEGVNFIAQLSQRDLSSKIPLNFVTVPGVAVSAACFGNGRYEEAAAAKCLSNLLANGFRRFDVDLYWDVSRQDWSLCPVELGQPSGQSSPTPPSVPSSTTAVTNSTGVAGTSSTSSLPTSASPRKRKLYVAFSAVSSVIVNDIGVRQQVTGSSLAIEPTTSAQASALPSVSTTRTYTPSGTGNVNNTTSGAPASSEPAATDGTLIQVGPYSCTTNLTVQSLALVVQEHLSITDNSLNATLKYLIMNLHVAAPANDPTASPSQPSQEQLPSGNMLLSNMVVANISSYLYTPSNLAEQRSSLNGSRNWFQVDGAYPADSGYFQLEQDGAREYTPDGWPSEGFVEFDNAKRMLIGFGRLDPQMSNYNLSGDASTIFSPGYLTSDRSVTLSSEGDIQSGCFYNSDYTAVKVVNSSWAIASDNTSTIELRSFSEQSAFVDTAAANLTNCGITPVLNSTLSNVTADGDYQPYKSYVLNTVWSWGPGQPANSSEDDSGQNTNRCAFLNATSGFWEAGYCGEAHYVACRLGTPYNWTISDAKATYFNAEDACPPLSTFSTPQTSLQNTYLKQEWLHHIATSSEDIDSPLLYLNFNDLDVNTCWVIGQNATCPYQETHSHSQRTVIVPVVASVIVFVLFLLTIFVKCAANRQYTKRRRKRGYDMLDDYEGVPS